MLELELSMLELEGGGISGPLGVGELVSSEQDRSAVAIKAMLAKWNLNLVIKTLIEVVLKIILVKNASMSNIEAFLIFFED